MLADELWPLLTPSSYAHEFRENVEICGFEIHHNLGRSFDALKVSRWWELQCSEFK